jgi:hypothetical protein
MAALSLQSGCLDFFQGLDCGLANQGGMTKREPAFAEDRYGAASD